MLTHVVGGAAAAARTLQASIFFEYGCDNAQVCTHRGTSKYTQQSSGKLRTAPTNGISMCACNVSFTPYYFHNADRKEADDDNDQPTRNDCELMIPPDTFGHRRRRWTEEGLGYHEQYPYRYRGQVHTVWSPSQAYSTCNIRPKICIWCSIVARDESGKI